MTTIARRPARNVRPMSLWEMTVWTYKDQRAHVYLKHPYDWFLWAVADMNLIEDGPRKKVHVDAATLHGEVLELGQRGAELIAFYAAMASQPEPPLAMPHPFPTTPDRAAKTPGEKRQRWSWADYKGKREDVLIVSHEEYLEEVPVWERYGRKGMRQAGTRKILRPVEYCPVTWLPELVWVENEAAVHRDWLLAMNYLYDRLERNHFRDHDVVDFGIDARYVEIDRPLIVDTRTIELDEKYATPDVAVDTNPQRVVPEDVSDPNTKLYGVRATTRIK